MNTHQIRIIATLEVLTQTWDAEWAQKHHAKTYTATITDGGWAQIDGAKFPPGSFEILPEKPVKPVKHRLTLIEGHSQSATMVYEYRGATITGVSNACSSSPYTRTRRWTVSGLGGYASSLKDAKSRVDFARNYNK